MLPYQKAQPLDSEAEERLNRALQRVLTTGGLPMDDKQRKSYMGWLRTLARRGHLKESFLMDGDGVGDAFTLYFPNPVSRAQYIRAILIYLSGLTVDEWQKEYPQLYSQRETLIRSLKGYITSANQERKANAANAVDVQKKTDGSSILS
jgi:hypothetical protein